MAKENFGISDVVSPHGYTYPAFTDIKESSVLTEDHFGKRVFVAGEKIPKKFYLLQVHKAGDKGHQQDAYTIRTGKYKADSDGSGTAGRDSRSSYLTDNFFFFTVDTNTATTGSIKGGGYGCSVGPVTIEA